MGQTLVLYARITPSNAEKGREVTWSSSDNSIATVEEGKVITLKAGVVTIKAKIPNGSEATCQITIEDVAPIIKDADTYEEYSFCNYLNMTVNETRLLKANTAVTYSSTNRSVAYVDGSGQLKAVGLGACTIKATNSNGAYSSFEVRVYDCAVSNNNRYTIKNYEASYDENSGAYVKGDVISMLEATINNTSFKKGKLLNINCDVEKIEGEFEDPMYITFEIYDNDHNLLCKRMVIITEYLLFGQKINTDVVIDLSNYYQTNYNYNFSLKIVDTNGI